MFLINFLEVLCHNIAVIYSLFVLNSYDPYEPLFFKICFFGIFIDYFLSVVPSKCCILSACFDDLVCMAFILTQISKETIYKVYFLWLFFYFIVKNRFRYHFWFNIDQNTQENASIV